MRRLFKKFSLRISLSIVASITSSISIITLVFIGKNENIDKIIRILFPLVFWISLILEQIFIWSANSIRNKLEAEGKLRRIRGRPGALSILQTEEGAITDLVLIISIITLAVLMLFKIGKDFTQYLFILLIVLSFRLHCIFNGKNFRYKKYLAKRKVD